MAKSGLICGIFRIFFRKKNILFAVTMCYALMILVGNLPDDKNLSQQKRGKYKLGHIREKIEHLFDGVENNVTVNAMKGQRRVVLKPKRSSKRGGYKELPKAIEFQINATKVVKHVEVEKEVAQHTVKLKLQIREKLNNDEELKCNFSQLSIDDTRVDEDFGMCKFPNITNDVGFDSKINNMEDISLPLLANYKNPCWYESLPMDSKYRGKVHMFWFQVKQSFDRIMPVMLQRRKRRHLWRLRCLPKVYIIGLTKCGVTDLHYSILQHPHAAAAATKEPFYWSRDRWKWNSPITDYLDLFDEAAEEIRALSVPGNAQQGAPPHAYHPMVTLDGSVNYLYEFGGLDQIKGNNPEKDGPMYVTPHLLKLLTPNSDIKVILTVRNPTQRLFGSYCLHQAYEKVSPMRFHTVAQNQIKLMTSCLNDHALEYCVYDQTVTKSMEKIELFAGIYYVFVKEWLTVFPNMKIIRWEDYKMNKKVIFVDLLNYIDLDPKLMKSGVTNSVINEDEEIVKMLPKTEKMLDEFYKPHNEKLAKLLGDDRFKFIT